MFPTELEDVSARTARAKLIGGVLHVKMPQHWPPAYKDQTLLKFQRWALKQAQVSEALPPLTEWDGRVWEPAAFDGYVRRLNDDTLQVPLQAVRIGDARRSRLAQANTRTRVLTFSRYAINGMPARALRYLVLHELAHLIEANHSPRFWALVARFEPDYKRQRAIAQAHHARMAEIGVEPAPGVEVAAAVAETAAAPQPTPVPLPARTEPPQPPAPSPEAHPFGPLFSFIAAPEFPAQRPSASTR